MKDKDLLLAKCRVQSVPTSMFFEDFENLSLKEKKKILTICSQCPVKDKCLEDALAHKNTYGVWGGKFFKKGRPMSIALDSEKSRAKASA